VEREHVCFDFPEPIRDGQGRVVGLSMDGCGLLVRNGLPLLPIKVLKFKFELGTKIKTVEVEVGRVRELKIEAEVLPAPAPVPVSALGQPSVPPKPPDQGLFPGKWYEHRIYYGIDPEDLRRKVFLVVRLYPVQYDTARHVFLWAEEMDVEVRAERGDGAQLRPVQEPLIRLLIITGDVLLPAALELASYKNSTGMTSIVRTVEWIDAHYSGRDLQEKIRNCVREAVEELGITFVLILGDHSVVPARLVYIPDGYEDGDPSIDGSLVETDLYYADVFPAGSSWNNDGDGQWGELPDEPIEGYPDVLVGRFPADDVGEAGLLLDKIKAYYQGKAIGGDWLDRMLLMGVDISEDYPGAEGEILKDRVAFYAPPTAEIVKLYESYDELWPGRIEEEMERGCIMANFAGHGYPTGWWLGDGSCFTTYNVRNLDNGFMMPVVFTMACLTSRFSDCDSIGEEFVLKPGGGAIAYFGATRVSWARVGTWVTYDLAGKLDLLFCQAFFSGKLYLGQVWAQAIEDYLDQFDIRTPEDGYYIHWKVIAEYGAPFGDPSLRLVGGPPVHELEIVCLDADGEVPVPDVDIELSLLGVTIATSSTGPDGSVRFTNLPPGPYLVRAYYEGLKVGEAKVLVPTTEPFRILCSLFDLVVKCTDRGGEPLPGARVELSGPGCLNLSGLTGPDGTLRFEDLPNTTYTLRVYWDRPEEAEVFLRTLRLLMDEQLVEACCEDVVDVVFVVRDAWGRPVEGAEVKLYYGGRLVETATTGPDGRVEFEDLLCGDYKAVASAELASPIEKRVAVLTHGQVVELRLDRWLSPIELYALVVAICVVVVASAAIAVARRRREKELKYLSQVLRWGYY